MRSLSDYGAVSAEGHCSRSSRGARLTSLESRKDEGNLHEESVVVPGFKGCVLWATLDRIC
jgi:hypothetical protein